MRKEGTKEGYQGMEEGRKYTKEGSIPRKDVYQGREYIKEGRKKTKGRNT